MPEKYLYFFSNPILSTYIFFQFSFNLGFAEIGNWLGQLLSLVVFTTCHITTELINHRNKEVFLNCRNLKRNFVYYGQFCLLASLKVSQSNRDCTHQLNDFHLDSVLTWSFTHKSFCLICFRLFSAHDSEQWYTARQSTEMFPKAQMRENSVISGFKGTSHYLTSLPQTKNIARVLWLFMVNAMLSQAHEVTVTSRWDWCEQATRCWSPALRSQCFSQSSQNTELLKRVSLLSQLFLVMDQISSPKMQSASEWYIQKFNQDVGNSIFDSFSNQKKKVQVFFFWQAAITVLNRVFLCNVSHVIKLIQGLKTQAEAAS